MQPENITKIIQDQIDERLRFANAIYGDTPTDAYQLVPKKYADTGGPIDTMSYASIITLNTSKGRLHTITTVNAIGATSIVASSGGVAGQYLDILITNDSTSGKNITFGTNFSPTSLVGITSKVAEISFVSNGIKFYEKSRVLGQQ